MFDLTAYLVGPSEQELEELIDCYETICPTDRRVRYTIRELEYWDVIARPQLTISGRAAASAGVRRPYLEPVRQRIREGRAFEIGIWDGRPIDDLEGSWSFRCRRIHSQETGLYAFVRVVMPLVTNHDVLRKVAGAVGDAADLYSGHAGLAFVYDPWLKEAALDDIYAQARRSWGIDVEEMTDTLPLMRDRIKGVNWITLVGSRFATAPEVQATLDGLAKASDVTIQHCKHALMLVAGPQPVVGDQHRLDHSLNPYYAVANALKPLFLDAHPDFSSERFIKNGNTLGWIRRFIEPDGWR